jgi:cytochrome P450
MPRLPDLPGPKGSLVLGCLPQMRDDVFGFYERVHREHGGLAAFRVAHLPIVFVSAPELVEQVLVTDRDKLEKSWDYEELARVLGRGLLTNEGDDWQRKRRLIQPSFHHDRIAAYGEIMVRRTQHRIDTWQDGAPIDVPHEMSAITLEVIAESMLGVEIEADSALIGDTLDRFMRQFERMITAPVPLPLWVPTPGNLAAFRALRRLDERLLGIIAARREQLAAGATDEDLLSRLLAARFDDGSALTDRELRDELLTMIMAGHETTALALTFTLLLLHDHPAVRERLRDELDTVLAGRAPTLEDIPRLCFTRHVVDESLRLYPPAWGLGRQVKQGEVVTLRGARLVGGTQIAIAQWVNHRDPAVWGDDALAFKPERWEDEAAAKQRHKYSYFPFAGGPRSCVGMHFALMEAVLILAEITRRFDIDVTEARPIDLMPAITLRPRHGLSAVVRKRAARVPLERAA